MGSRSRPKPILSLAIASTLLLVAAALAGCVEVRVVGATPSALSSGLPSDPLPAAGQAHNLAVVAVEFDPPLDYQRLILRRQSITLLVALENRGSETEHDVTVQAELSTPADPTLHLARSTGTPSIAPGEIQVVRFPALSAIPFFDAYHLEVIVDALPGEINLDDNRKAFDIQIRQQTGNPQP
jgi:hypothetical protein